MPETKDELDSRMNVEHGGLLVPMMDTIDAIQRIDELIWFAVEINMFMENITDKIEFIYHEKR